MLKFPDTKDVLRDCAERWLPELQRTDAAPAVVDRAIEDLVECVRIAGKEEGGEGEEGVYDGQEEGGEKGDEMEKGKEKEEEKDF